MPATSGLWASAFSSPFWHGQGKLVDSLLVSVVPHSFMRAPLLPDTVQVLLGWRPVGPPLDEGTSHNEGRMSSPARTPFSGAAGRSEREAQAQGSGGSGCLLTPSCSAASRQGLGRLGGGAGWGAVSRMKRSSAATTAAASSGEAFGATICSWGRRLIIG